VPGGASVLLAVGKLGGREMTASSDLDLILIYDCADGTVSDGPRPLAPAHYFARLTQRLVAALTAPMAEGRVYDVDLRLRPSGRAGPLATQLSSFVAYQANEAWTWEHMALTRARPVTGSPGLASRVEAAIRNVLTGPRDAGTTLAEVRAMRGRIARDKRDGGPWDVKLAPGGLLDVEFIAQALQLVHAHAHPEILDTNTETALAKAAAAGLLAPADAELLLGACRLYQAVTQILRLAWDGPFAPAAAPGGLCRLLAQAMGEPDLERAEACLVERQAAVRAAFVRLVGPPDEAAELRVRAPAEGEEAP
jgi:glutamate-ammonia-ligase adenylyltransferase